MGQVARQRPHVVSAPQQRMRHGATLPSGRPDDEHIQFAHSIPHVEAE
jgi:hypothetical protein